METGTPSPAVFGKGMNLRTNWERPMRCSHHMGSNGFTRARSRGKRSWVSVDSHTPEQTEETAPREGMICSTGGGDK